MELFAHLSLILFAAFIAISAVPGSTLFSWHPTCMSLAILFWTESIISFRRPRLSLRANVHWALNATAITLAICGFLAIYRNKEANKQPHFVSYHGLFGVATMGLLVVQSVGGNILNLAIKKFLPIRPALIKFGHKISGGLSLTAVYTSLLLGMSSIWFKALVNTTLMWWGVALCITYPYLYAVFNADFSKGKPKEEKAKN